MRRIVDKYIFSFIVGFVAVAMITIVVLICIASPIIGIIIFVPVLAWGMYQIGDTLRYVWRMHREDSAS